MGNNEVVMRENNPKMVPIPREYSPDFWSFDPEDSVELTCLMPNGIVILMKVSYNATLLDIKAVCTSQFTKALFKISFRICGRRPQSTPCMGNSTTCRRTFSRALIAWQKERNYMMKVEESAMLSQHALY